MKYLVVVESPGKITKISSFLDANYVVKATYGHIRDLDPKKMSIDFEHHFEPIYIIMKPDVVRDLKFALRDIDMTYIATDDDLDGYAIAQSVIDVLKPKKYKRMIFTEISKNAITDALKNAGEINHHIVDAQKARRVIDRLFGYIVSPLLQKQIQKHLSAGRTQSPTTRLVVDKENEINNFIKNNADNTYFKTKGVFQDNINSILYQLAEKVDLETEDKYHGKIAQIPVGDSLIVTFLKQCLRSEFRVHNINDKMIKRYPSPPFITSTLQQEANRKFGMPIDLTMKTAQKLYEAGFITYMRTDSVIISDEGHKQIKKVVDELYGQEYYQKNIYKSKSASAQLAHECCRPTHLEYQTVDDKINDANQIKLYKLIWQRTVASQMKPADIKVITIQVSISKLLNEKIKPYYYFQSKIEKIIFLGFMKVYTESTDVPEEEMNTNYTGKIPKQGSIIGMTEIISKQEYMKPPYRYTEASLVKKLDELGIGRPSTYVNTIKTIFDRKYVKLGNVPGVEKEIMVYSIKSENGKHKMAVYEETDSIFFGQETNKIIPTNLGTIVNEYLVTNFPEMLDYQFTANMESDLDKIAENTVVWYKVVQIFYDKLKFIVDGLNKEKHLIKDTEKYLGKDKDGNKIYATKFGIKKQIGDKILYGNYTDTITFDNVTLETAIKILEYPKILGEDDGGDVLIQKGPYGFYLIYKKVNYAIPKDMDATKINLEDAIKIINKQKANLLGTFNITRNGKKVVVTLLNGDYGPYLQIKIGNKKINYPVPKNLDFKKLTDEQVLEIISKKKTAPKKKNYRKK